MDPVAHPVDHRHWGSVFFNYTDVIPGNTCRKKMSLKKQPYCVYCFGHRLVGVGCWCIPDIFVRFTPVTKEMQRFVYP